jgi:hypothetical protein
VSGVTPRAGNEGVKLELNDQERRAVRRALAERKTLLIENAGDTTKTRATQRSAFLELAAISSALRKLLTRTSGGRVK